VADSGLREGAWALCETSGWADNDTHRQLVAWCWTGPAGRAVVVVNLSAAPAQGRVHLPWQDLAGGTWTFEDRLAGARFNRGGDELARDGLFVDLPAWGAHFLT
jgi:ABC-type Fe3+ transport system substrate-binding protein